jgi:transposase-like protein
MTDGTDSNGSRNPEVPEKAARRRFDEAYKRRILEEADRCTQPGQLGELLRREGLYSSLLSTWRRQRHQGVRDARRPKKRGRKAAGNDPLTRENERLRRENQRLAQRLRQAEAIIEVQKKVSDMLGIPPENQTDPEDR